MIVKVRVPGRVNRTNVSVDWDEKIDSGAVIVFSGGGVGPISSPIKDQNPCVVERI